MYKSEASDFFRIPIVKKRNHLSGLFAQSSIVFFCDRLNDSEYVVIFFTELILMLAARLFLLQHQKILCVCVHQIEKNKNALQLATRKLQTHTHIINKKKTILFYLYK